MPLDRTRPYAEVIGRPGVAYEQDGRSFRTNGEEYVPPAPVAPVQAPEPVVEKAVPAPAKRGPGRPRKELYASTALAAQFAGYEWTMGTELTPDDPKRDVLVGYRDPQATDGSMARATTVWADGV